MSIRIVRLGSPRAPDERLRIGTVRRPPRGVPKAEFAARDFYDCWFPNLSPSPGLMTQGQAAHSPQAWHAFVRAYRKEMATPESSHAIGLLAALSHHLDFSVGCYCEDESHCHRAILRELLRDAGGKIVD